MINILVECPDLIASVKVGVLNNLKKLVELKKCNVIFKKTLNIKLEDILLCDILISVRGCEYISSQIVKIAQKLNRFIIYFLDDDLLNIPDKIASSVYFKDKGIIKNLKLILGICDVFWYINPLILEKYKQYISARTVYTEVAVELIENRNDIISDDNKINILYAGSIDHTPIVQKYISPAAKKLDDEFKGLLTFTFIGVNPQIDQSNTIKYYSFFSDYNEYIKIVTQKQYHIGLAPIPIDDFYKCKYVNKLFEYTKIGAVGIYTNSLPYTVFVRDGQNGFLCNNNVDDWYNAIKKAVLNEHLRNNCVEKAELLIKTKFNIDTITNDLVNSIPELITFKADDKNVQFYIKLWFKAIPLLFYINRLNYFFRNYGLKAIPLIFYKFLKKTIRLFKE